MATFQKVKLNDCVTFKTGKLNSNAAVIGGKYSFFTCSQEIYKTNTYAFDTECVLLGGNNASAVYPVFYYNGKFDAYQRTYVIEPKEKNNIRFFYYLISKKLAELKEKSTGATTKFLTIKILHNIEVSLPDPKTQTHIASVLSAYDDLIENNEKRIKALEEMAQLLYTEWFVKFKFPGHETVKMVESGTEYGMVPEGWEVKKLGESIIFKKGKNITKDTVNFGSVPVVAGGLGPAYFHDTPNTKNPVVTISASGANAGFLRLYLEDVWASDCSFVDLSITPHVYFYYLFLENKRSDISQLQRGSAQPHVYPKDLMSLKIACPPKAIIGNFNDRVSPLFRLIGNLEQKNRTLSKTRDLLIPQLVTGKQELKV